MNKRRISRVIENMRAENLSQIIVSAPESVYYLTGTFVSPGERMLALLLKDDGSITLFANRLFALTGNTSVPLVEFDRYRRPHRAARAEHPARKNRRR